MVQQLNGNALPGSKLFDEGHALLYSCALGLEGFDLSHHRAQARGFLLGGSDLRIDLRGFPAKDAHTLAGYWVTGNDSAQWMLIPRFDRPFAQWSQSWSIGWQRPRDPALAGPYKVALIDGRTFNYAESLAAYFPAQKTGPMVGERTAGANGNVAHATLPSAMSFFFSSMRVTLHDGATSMHARGIAPDEPASPTVEGLRAGRDEVLEHAIRLIERRSAR